VRWIAVEITMVGGDEIAKDGGCGDEQRWRNGHRSHRIIAMGKAAQWETAQDGRQRQLQWTAAARLQWKVAVVMGNGGTMGSRTAKQSRWAMGQ
jgi:hypothetical protein